MLETAQLDLISHPLSYTNRIIFSVNQIMYVDRLDCFNYRNIFGQSLTPFISEKCLLIFARH
jgi:hypothetical protein